MSIPAGATKDRFVRTMFDAIAPRYDLMNRLMTGGLDGSWRRLTADSVYPEVLRVALDVGAGTGDLSVALSRLAPRAHVISVDFSAGMLRLAQSKSREMDSSGRIHPVLGDAMTLPVRESSVDAIISGFTLRNVNDVPTVLAESYRALRPGGRLSILELSPMDPTGFPLLRALFRLYFHRLVPLAGALISRRGYAYRYLPQSVDGFPDAHRLREMLLGAGFAEAGYRRLGLGTVALHTAEKKALPAFDSPRDSPQQPGAAHPAERGPLAPVAGDASASLRLPARDVRSGEDTQREATRSTGMHPVHRLTALSMREVSERHDWNQLLLRLPNAHGLQCWERGELSRQTNWTARRLVFELHGQVVAAASVLRRPLPGLSGWGIAYCPKGPVLDYGDHEVFGRTLALLSQDARRQRSIFLEIDPDVEHDRYEAIATLRRAGYAPSPEQVQFRSTVLANLRGSDEELLARMKSRRRAYVRKAARDGVTVRSGALSDLARFYELYEQTAQRDGFIIRPFAYYERYWSLLAETGLSELFFAEVDGRPEAALVPLRFGKRAWYLWGASSAAGQRAHAPSLLQWHTMRWARDLGCDTYDMWGAPDDPSDERDPTHGLYLFKQSFGGRHVRWIGAYDYVTSRTLYTLWNVARPRVLELWRAVKRERAAGHA